MRSVGRVAVGGVVLVVIIAGLALRLGGYALGWTALSSSPPADGPTLGRFSERGPHHVGLRMVSVDGPNRSPIWYPTDADPGGVRYAYGLKALGEAPFALATYRGMATRDAPRASAGSPSPLVVLSPGFAFGAASYGWLAEHLASHGFAVLALEHAELLDPDDLWRATVQRPRDVLAALDAIEEEARTGPLRGIVDPGRVAVAGHSYGGYTALAAAGARLDTSRLVQACDAVPPDDPIVFQCDALVPHVDDMAATAELHRPPDGLWPDWGDVRVRAAVTLAGDAVMFGRHGLATVTVPVLAIGGTADVDAPYEWGTRLVAESVSSEHRVEVGLADGEHMLFTAPCETVRRVLALMPEPFCADPAWNRAAARAIVAHFVTAFLLAELTADEDAALALSAPTTRMPNVRHTAIGYQDASKDGQ